MTDYIKREDAERLLRYDFLSALTEDERVDELNRVPSADVVEIGLIRCFGIKFVVEGDTIKVKWRHGDKHYIVPFGGLLELWEKYEEQENDKND